MIEAIEIENFKCHAQLKLRIDNLTVFSGLNAGGKSSAYQPLLLLAQAFKAGQGGQRISLNGPLVHLGTFPEVFGNIEQETSRLFRVTLRVSDRLYTWNLQAPDDSDQTALHIKDLTIQKSSQQIILVGEKGKIETPEEISDLLKSVCFLSAIRGSNQEVFATPGVAELSYGDVGPYGEYAAYWLNKLSDTPIAVERGFPGEDALTLRRQLSAWGGALFPEFDVTSSDLGSTGLINLQMRNSLTDVYRRPSNVGYGLSYAFPILVAGLICGVEQLLVIDSPEAHLHPRAQSQMGKFLAAMAMAGAKIIVETHSDHVLNGIRLAIKQGNLSSHKCKIYFFAKKYMKSKDEAHLSTKTVIIEPMIDKHGKIDRWPEGFFDQIETDLAQL